MSTKDSNITTIDDTPEPAVVAKEKTKSIKSSTSMSANADKVLVNIAMGAGEEGKGNVFLSNNGRNVYVPRGTWHEIDAEFLSVLDDAQMIVYDANDGVMTPRPVPRFAYQSKAVA